MAATQSPRDDDLAGRGLEVVLLPLDRITADPGVQSRAALDEDAVREYARVLLRPTEGEREGGDELPPGLVFFDGQTYWLASGFHRREGHLLAGRNSMAVHVVRGTRRDAVLHSAGCNARHPVRRSTADKRRAGMLMLTDAEWSQWPNARIARHCGIDEKTVGNYRRELALERLGVEAGAREEEEADEDLGEEETVEEPPVAFVDADPEARDRAKELRPIERLPEQLSPEERQDLEDRVARLVRKVERISARLGQTPEQILAKYRVAKKGEAPDSGASPAE